LSLALDRVDERAVLFDCSRNQKEAFARETSQRRRVVSFHTHAQPKHACLFSRGLLALASTTVTINKSAKNRDSRSAHFYRFGLRGNFKNGRRTPRTKI
jgi:hypothetical protein